MKPDTVEASTWTGEIATGEVPIEITEPLFDRGGAVEPALKTSNDIVRVRQSNPVTVNNTKFVAVAESNWELGEKNVPVEIQLHITNQSETELIFETFDSFGLGLKDSQGRRLQVTGGRNATCITRPFSIAKGASYAICRKRSCGGTRRPGQTS